MSAAEQAQELAAKVREAVGHIARGCASGRSHSPLSYQQTITQDLDELVALASRATRLETEAELWCDQEARLNVAYSEIADLRKRAFRLLFIAEHLFEMVPRDTWIEQGGDDGQGHYEGDYHAEQVRDELAVARSALEGQQGSALTEPGVVENVHDASAADIQDTGPGPGSVSADPVVQS